METTWPHARLFQSTGSLPSDYKKPEDHISEEEGAGGELHSVLSSRIFAPPFWPSSKGLLAGFATPCYWHNPLGQKEKGPYSLLTVRPEFPWCRRGGTSKNVAANSSKSIKFNYLSTKTLRNFWPTFLTPQNQAKKWKLIHNCFWGCSRNHLPLPCRNFRPWPDSPRHDNLADDQPAFCREVIFTRLDGMEVENCQLQYRQQ